jgi:delta1-piperideine-2-carboxylate reductase
MTTLALTELEIHDLARSCLLVNGCDEANAEASARTISSAERSGAVSHGLFRLPGYVASLRSGMVTEDSLPWRSTMERRCWPPPLQSRA